MSKCSAVQSSRAVIVKLSHARRTIVVAESAQKSFRSKVATMTTVPVGESRSATDIAAGYLSVSDTGLHLYAITWADSVTVQAAGATFGRRVDARLDSF